MPHKRLLCTTNGSERFHTLKYVFSPQTMFPDLETLETLEYNLGLSFVIQPPLLL